jgi:hypothetical protein
MFETLVGLGAMLFIGGVLWLRPWIDDHYQPYD